MHKIYLDHNATTPVHQEVLDVMLPFYADKFGNPSSVHSEGREARVSLDEARDQVANLIGAKAVEVIFTSGGSESNNFAILGVALSLNSKKRHIVTSEVEHSAILNPLKQLETFGFHVDYIPVDYFGRIDIKKIENVLTDSTVLVTIQHANSEVGTLQDISEIGKLVQKKGILFHTDAVQSVGKIPVNVNDLSVDLLSLSSHKIYGPKGVGALFVKQGTPSLFSLICGGGQEKKRRGGTENVPGIVGFGKACQIAQHRLNKGDTEQFKKMRDELFEKIKKRIPKVKFFGCFDKCLPNTLNCGFEGADGEELLIALDMAGISVSTGSACSSGSGLPSQVLSAMGLPESIISASLRFSLGWSNSLEDIDFIAKTLSNAVELSRNRSRTSLKIG